MKTLGDCTRMGIIGDDNKPAHRHISYSYYIFSQISETIA